MIVAVDLDLGTVAGRAIMRALCDTLEEQATPKDVKQEPEAALPEELPVEAAGEEPSLAPAAPAQEVGHEITQPDDYQDVIMGRLPIAQPASSSAADQAASNGWTPRQDMKLLELLTAGEKRFVVAEAVSHSAAGVVRRFRQLVPNPGIVAQRKALERAARIVRQADEASVPAPA